MNRIIAIIFALVLGAAGLPAAAENAAAGEPAAAEKAAGSAAGRGAGSAEMGALEVEVTLHPEEYRALLSRFVQADTTLTPAEVEKVYYGFPFTCAYEPRDSFPALREAFDSGDYREAARLLPEALELNPVSLDLLVMAMAVYDAAPGGEADRRSLNASLRSDMIASAILESGRGTIAPSPFRVICRKDMERILRNVLGVGVIVGVTHAGKVLAVKFRFPGKLREHILYFNNSLEENFLSTHPL